MNLIFQNALATYARSVVALGLGLFSSRWVLQALGASDFGISVAVGSLMAFGTFVGELLRISVARNFAYAIGRTGPASLSRWFHAAFLLHAVLACALVAVLLPIGEGLLRWVLVLPDGRLGTALVLLRLSLLSLFVTTLTVPFGALFTAHQRFAVPSVAGVVQSAWVFAWAWVLCRIQGDRLAWYGVYMCLGILGLQLVQVVWSIRVFGIRRDWIWADVDREKVGAHLSFACWNLFGGGGFLMAVHGSAFVTNRFFGTVGNAAYGIAQQVHYHTEALANALVGAFEPAVTTRSAAGNSEGARRLAGRGGLLAALLLAFFAVPLVFEMDTVLTLWLVDPPPYAGRVCSLLLSVGVVNKLTIGQQIAIAANGRIARWQVVSGVLQTLALPLTLVLAALGGGILSAAAAYAAVFAGCICANIHYGGKVAGMPAGAWLAGQAAPFALALACAVGAAFVPRLWMDEGLPRLFATCCATSLIFGADFCILFRRWKKST